MARKSKYTPDQRAALRKARQKKQEKYWNDRAQSRVLATDRQGDRAQAEQKQAYEDAKKSVRLEIEKFYEKFSDETGIDSHSARKNLTNRELDDFKKELERKLKVIKEMLAKDPNNDKLRAYDTEFDKLSKVRALTRREALEANIKAEIVKLGETQEQQLNNRSNNIINTALRMNDDDLSMLGDVDAKLGVGHPEQVRRAAKENWQHGDFSDKILSDKEKLINETRNVLTRAFVHHDGAIDTARRLSGKMNASESNALRLVRTEFNHLSNQAALAEYKAKGIKKYKFVAAIDSRTSDICRELDGQIFNVADAKTGKNFPPMHPNCRSVTTPVIDWDDEDEWDYSGIELDDDELKKLGLTDEDVAEIDSVTHVAPDAPAPSLSVADSNRAVDDTQSVQRRAEKEDAVKQQGEAIEIKARNVNDDIGNIIDDIDRNERINRTLYVDTPIVRPQAAIEAKNLERVQIDILKAELEAQKLQARAAKLDESIPKPDPKRAATLEDTIDRKKEARQKRGAADPSNDEVIASATPRAFELPEPDASDAIEPRTEFGKWWQKVRDAVERAKVRFNEWVSGFSVRAKQYYSPSQMASKTLVEDGTVSPKIDHKEAYRQIQERRTQDKAFDDFMNGHVETDGWDAVSHECVPELSVLEEVHRLFDDYLYGSDTTHEISFEFGHPNDNAFNMACHWAFGDTDDEDDYRKAGGVFGIGADGRTIIVLRSTVTLDGLHHEIGHAIHSHYLDDDESKDPVLTKAIEKVWQNENPKFMPYGVDRSEPLIDVPKRGFEVELLKALTGKSRFGSVDEYKTDASKYAGLLTAFHNINAIVRNSNSRGIHWGNDKSECPDSGWKELFANTSTIYLSGNKKAAIFLETHYKPIAEYVKTRIDKSRRRQP